MAFIMGLCKLLATSVLVSCESFSIKIAKHLQYVLGSLSTVSLLSHITEISNLDHLLVEVDTVL